MNSVELRIELEGENVLVLFEDEEGNLHSIDSIRFDRNGVGESDVPAIVLEAGSIVEIE